MEQNDTAYPCEPDWIVERFGLTASGRIAYGRGGKPRQHSAYPLWVVGHYRGDPDARFSWQVPNLLSWRYVLSGATWEERTVAVTIS